MEPSKAKVRAVPESRIKKLVAYEYLDSDDAAYLEMKKSQLIQDAGRAIAEKLAEFHKFEIVQGIIGFQLRSTIEVIVPPTPENAWPPNRYNALVTPSTPP